MTRATTEEAQDFANANDGDEEERAAAVMSDTDDFVARGAARFRARQRERNIIERLREFLPPNEKRHRTLASDATLALALQDAAYLFEELRDLVQCLLDNDPAAHVSDGGVTVLDVWREDARRVLGGRKMFTDSNAGEIAAYENANEIARLRAVVADLQNRLADAHNEIADLRDKNRRLSGRHWWRFLGRDEV